MSGFLNVLVAAGAGKLNTGANWDVTNFAPTTGTRSARRTFITDGSTTHTGSGVDPNWWNPVTTGIGNAWYVRFTTTSSANTNVTGMTSGTWYPLTSDQFVQFQNSATNVEGTGSGTIHFSPDNGTTIITGWTISWDVGFAP